MNLFRCDDCPNPAEKHVFWELYDSRTKRILFQKLIHRCNGCEESHRQLVEKAAQGEPQQTMELSMLNNTRHREFDITLDEAVVCDVMMS